jgi:molybdate transport system substrate-binding protein
LLLMKRPGSRLEDKMRGARLHSVMTAGIAVAFLVGVAGPARAADVTFLCAGALESSLQELKAEFEKASGHLLRAKYASIGAITRRLRDGEPADLGTVSPAQWDELNREGKLDPGFRVVIAKVGVGVFVKQGAAKPNLASTEAFKRALLNARSVALADPAGGGPVGAYVARLFERLGISAEMKSKLRLVGGGLPPIQPVVEGNAEFGLTTISEILASPNIELAGPLPADIQSYIVFTAAIPKQAREPAAAKTLVDFLSSPRAASVFKSKGLDRD